MLDLVIWKPFIWSSYVNLLFQLYILWRLNKYRSNIFSENLASELRCARSVKYQISELLQKKDRKYFISKYWLHVEMIVFWIYWVIYNELKLMSAVLFTFFGVATRTLKFHILHYILLYFHWAVPSRLSTWLDFDEEVMIKLKENVSPCRPLAFTTTLAVCHQPRWMGSWENGEKGCGERWERTSVTSLSSWG